MGRQGQPYATKFTIYPITTIATTPPISIYLVRLSITTPTSMKRDPLTDYDWQIAHANSATFAIGPLVDGQELERRRVKHR